MKVIHSFKTYKKNIYYVALQKNIKYLGRQCYGTCDPPEEEPSFIRLEERQNESKMFLTAIHEMAHAFFPQESETSIDRFSKACVSLLKKLGYTTKKTIKEQ